MICHQRYLLPHEAAKLCITLDAQGAITHLTRVGEEDALLPPCPAGLAAQLYAVLDGIAPPHSLNLAPSGTPFQQAVWQALLEIPYGETRSYGEVATSIGAPNAARAVGSACAKNPIWLLIPCHRVIQSSGGLGGYAGKLTMKQQLLDMEKTPRQARQSAA